MIQIRKISGKVLVVDDDLPSLELVGYLLKKYFPNVVTHTVNDGTMALTRIEKNDYDLIIIDYGLGDMTGEELASVIKSNCNSLIIMITASGAYMIEGEKLNDYDIIDKANGFNDELTNKVGMYLNLASIKKHTTIMAERLENFSYVK